MALFFGDDFKNNVISANDIVDVVSEYVTLKKTGRNFLGLCPFHNEKSPSFSVSAEKQMYHCFGCGVGGNALDFVMRSQRLDFIEAVKYLAERANIPIIEDISSPRGVSDSKKETFYNMNRLAAKFFNDNLNQSVGRQAYDYLMKREISPSTITKFGLGYAQDSFSALLDFLKKEGFSAEDVYGAKLANKKDSNIYDAFRNRVMFPIIDLRGNVTGFGGRAMDDDAKPKYLNSSESLVFNKSNNLYGLNFAKSFGKSTLIIVEGYMDVIALHQAGIQNAVAALGTAFTNDHARLLKRYASCVVIAFDSDDAGRLATLRCIDILSDADIKIKVLSQDKAKDPDEFIKAYGRDAFLRLAEDAPGYIEYKLAELKKKYDFSKVEDKIRFVSEASDVLLTIKSAVELDVHIKKISGETDVSPGAIYSELKKRSGKAQTARKQIFPGEYKQVKLDTADNPKKWERMLLSLLYDDPASVKKYGRILANGYFTCPAHNEIFRLMSDGNGAISTIAEMDEDQKAVITEIALYEHHVEDKPRAIADIIKKIDAQKQRLNIEKSINDETLLAQAVRDSRLYIGK